MTKPTKFEVMEQLKFFLYAEHMTPLTWNELLGFCLGYYGEITLEMINAVRELETSGKLK